MNRNHGLLTQEIVSYIERWDWKFVAEWNWYKTRKFTRIDTLEHVNS
jgi:hypothetical protein